MTRLILIEGMIGVGKSTTAAHLALRLRECGEAVRAYHEFADDHPIRTRTVDLLRAASAEVASFPDTGPDGLARDASVYDVAQWRRLAERCRDGPETVILESTLLQNSILPAFTNGAPTAKVHELFTRIEKALHAAAPWLIHLRPRDIAAAISRTHEERGEPWSSRNLSAVSASPWARQRGLYGRNAVVQLYRAWEPVVDGLLNRCSFPHLVVMDPQRDRVGALRRIETFLEDGS